MKTKLYSRLASLIDSAARCDQTGNTEWSTRHRQAMRDLVKEHMPSGSGFDAGTTLDEDSSTPEKVVFDTSFHHMDEMGGYDGWTDHKVVVRPSLAHGFTTKVSGRDRNEIKDYIGEMFDLALKTEV
jgi:hypothetical protein